MQQDSHLHSQLTLPPNMTILEIKNVSRFILKVSNLIYLNKSEQPLMRVRWWGYDKVDYVPFKANKASISYFICSSMSKFLTYCNDMQLLQIEFCQNRPSHVLICRAMLNMKMLNGWQGQPYQTSLDLIQNRKKVGEILVQIKIAQQSYSGFSEHNQRIRQRNYQPSSLIHKPLPSVTKPSLTKPYNNIQVGKSSNQTPDRVLSQNNSLGSNSVIHVRQYRKSQKEAIREEFGSCICSRINKDNSEAQILALRQDYEMMFGFSSMQKGQFTQTIQLEFVKWVPSSQTAVKEQSTMIIDFPLPNKRTNKYELCSNQRGSFKVIINNNQFSEKEMQQYVKTAQVILILDDKCTGKVNLSKLLSHCGQDVIVAMSDIKNKKSNTLNTIKGHCQLKIIPPATEHWSEQVKHRNSQESSNKHPERTEAQTIDAKHQYIWIYINQFNPLQEDLYKNSNIFIRVINGDKQFIQTQTIWKSPNPTYGYIMTLQHKDQYVLELWDRQQKPLLIGIVKVGCLFKWEENFPVVNFKGTIVGYLSLCIGQGSLIDANKFLQLHMRKKQIPSTNYREKQNELQKSNHQPHESDSESKEEPQQQSHNSQQNRQNKEHVIDENERDQLNLLNIKREVHSHLSLIQLHNLVFTKMLLEESLANFRNRKLKLSQFQQLFEQRQFKQKYLSIPPWGISELASLYLNPQSNRVNSEQFFDSFDAFKLYYKDLQQFRDQVVKTFIEDLQTIGLTINLLEADLLNCRQIWHRIKQITGNIINIQKLRMYYRQYSCTQLCDKLRKFQVYETTFGDLLPASELKQYLIEQLCDLLDLNSNDDRFRSEIRKAQIELSKWQEINLFDHEQEQYQPKTQFMKCPTFGLLGLENMPQQLDSNRQSYDNSSILAGISPIYANNTNQLVMLTSNIDHIITKLLVNGLLITLSGQQQAITNLSGVKKGFRYTVVLQLGNGVVYQTEGSFNEWMGLTDDSGEYGGCLKICQKIQT